MRPVTNEIRCAFGRASQRRAMKPARLNDYIQELGMAQPVGDRFLHPHVEGLQLLLVLPRC